MEEFIKIPRDFNSLHDLGDLVSNFELTNKLMIALNGYQMSYVNSMLLTGDELLATIPQRDYSKYTLKCRGSEIERASIDIGRYGGDGDDSLSLSPGMFGSASLGINDLIKRNSRDIVSRAVKEDESCRWSSYLVDGLEVDKYFNTYVNDISARIGRINKLGDNKDAKMYLTNFKEKTVMVCYWAETARVVDDVVLAELDDKIKSLEDAYDKSDTHCGTTEYDIYQLKKDREKLLDIIPIRNCGENLNYNKKNISFDVDTTNNKMSIIIPFSFTDSYTVGGVWINGRKNGYLSGGKSTPYTRMGKDIYSFCTRTNKYIDFKEEIEEGRGWVEGGW